MKLLMLTWNYPPTVGGIEQVAHHTALGLRGLGHQVDVVAAALPAGTNDPAERREHLYRAKKAGIPAFLLHAFFTGWKLIRSKKPDAIICPSLTSAPAAWLISKLSRTPYVVQIHGSDILVPSRMYQFIIGILLRGAGILFTNSRNTTDLLVRRGIAASAIKVVCPGVTPPPPPAKKPSDATVRLLQEAKGRPTLLTVGRLVRRKGIQEFIETSLPVIAKRFPDILYLIVGGEPKASLIHQERIIDQLHAAIKSGGHDNRVQLLGRLSDADLEAVYQQAGIFVLPCLDNPMDVEGFGIVILEAALHRVPSVATRCGGIPDAIVDGDTGLLVEPGNFTAIAETVISLLDDRDLMDRLGRAAEARTRSEFTWAAVAARYAQGLQALISKSD